MNDKLVPLSLKQQYNLTNVHTSVSVSNTSPLTDTSPFSMPQIGPS